MLTVATCLAAAFATTAGATTATTTTTTTTTAPDAPPHIIFALADDLGMNNVGFRQKLASPELEPEVRTPTIDALAANGLLLDRMYSFKYCSPTRSSFLSGRLPLHVTQNNNNNLVTNPGGADLRMQLLPQRLKEVGGYNTSLVGKWHVGARSADNLPINRGFDQHFGFLKGGEDHQNQHSNDNDEGKRPISVVDLWRDRQAAENENGTFSTIMYAREAVRVIRDHGAALRDGSPDHGRLFMFLSWQAAHTPLEAPPGWPLRHVPNDTATATRAHMNALVEVLDQGMLNVTNALKESGMWNETLLVFQADNGGWIQNDYGGNNFPLRGGKVSDFEGGVRNVALLNGGWLPDNLRGTVHTGLAHVCDWYATFERLASSDGQTPSIPQGVDPSVPPLDSIDLWDSLSMPHATASNRTEIPLSFCNDEAACDSPSGVGDSALIWHNWKVVTGTQGGLGWHQGPRFPNASSVAAEDAGCPKGCLFDIFADPSELHDVKADNMDTFNRLLARLQEVGRTVFQTNYTMAHTCQSAEESAQAHGGFLAPRCRSP